MRLLRIFPDQPTFRFMHWRSGAFSLAIAMMLLTAFLLAIKGLNLGLDFAGGILIEAKAAQPIDLGNLRQRLAGLSLGEISLQTFGSPSEVLIRVQNSSQEPNVQQHGIAAVKSALGSGYEIRRTEMVGPQVSDEMLWRGVLAAGLAVLLIGIYVWFRFEWQFGVCAVVTTFHDVFATVGLFAALQLEFNLTLVAALLTIAGYSINDTVVVFDRIRENLRAYKSMPLDRLIDLSLNQTLSRTVLTSGTTLLAVVSLLLFGGPVLRGFALALTWGIVVGTISSIYVAAPLILYLQPSQAARNRETVDGNKSGEAPAPLPGGPPVPS